MLVRLRTVAALAALVAVGCQGAGTPFRTSAKQAQERFDIARLHEKDGQLAKADELYRELHDGRHEKARVCQRLGVVNTRLGNHEIARRYFEEAIALDSNDAEILTDYGYALITWGDHASAEKLLARALELDAQNRRAANNLGIAVAYQGRPDEAFRHFRRVNDEAGAHANLAYVHVQRGEGQQAIAQYSRALSINPELPAGRQGLLELAELEQRHRVNGIDPTTVAENRPATEADNAESAPRGDVAPPSEPAPAAVVARSEPKVENTVVPRDAPAEKLAGTDEEPTDDSQVAVASADDEAWELPEKSIVPAEKIAPEKDSVEKPKSGSIAGPAPAETTVAATDETEFPWEDFAGTAAEIAPVEFSDDRRSSTDAVRHASDSASPEIAPSRVVDESVRETKVSPRTPEVKQPVVEANPVRVVPASAPVVVPKRDRPAGPRVRWQELTIRYADHGGQKGALEVVHAAMLELARETDFDTVIAKYSDDANGSRGGHVDWTPRGEVSGAMESALFRLPVGVLSRVIVGEDAYRIIRVTERTEG